MLEFNIKAVERWLLLVLCFNSCWSEVRPIAIPTNLEVFVTDWTSMFLPKLMICVVSKMEFVNIGPKRICKEKYSLGYQDGNYSYNKIIHSQN